ncbi:MAG: class I SAM-dependent methyltransferase [Candidatus Staskawiczbacteria bacterium]|nr:class I SAM-dependent methyltransferase [Candidatus Staskawiczbacteria bacterium]
MKDQLSVKNKQSADLWNKYYKEEKVNPKAGFFTSYDIFLHDSILAKYFPFNSGSKEKVKICEIGSGDGKLLKKISDNFNYEPYGIEFAKGPIQSAKDRGINIIEGDAFSPEILEKYKEYFDVIYSYGFIEHIMPSEKAVEIHLQMLKKGGYFFIQIPRLKGFNYLKFRIFRPDLLPLHNLAIMEEEILRSLCRKGNVQELFCKNYGTFKLRIPMVKKNIRWYIFKAICSLEYILNPFCRLVFRDKGFETKLFSPCIIFIGRKI